MNDDLERALEQAGDGGGPPEGWQDKVLARIDQPAPRRRARWPLLVGGSGLLAAAAALALFVAMRDRERPAATSPAVDPAALERLSREIDRRAAVTERAAESLMQAKTEAEKLEALRSLEEKTRALEAMKKSLERLRPAFRKIDDGKIAVKCDPSDPLCSVE